MRVRGSAVENILWVTCLFPEFRCLKGFVLKTRILASQLVVALAVSGIAPSVIAATVGPNGGRMSIAPNGFCTVALNSQEAETYATWFNLRAKAVYAKAAVEAFERLYPGTDQLAQEFREEPSLAKLVDAHANHAYSELSVLGERQDQTEERYVARLQQLGLEVGAAKHLVGELTEAAIAEARPKAKPSDMAEREMSAPSHEDAAVVRGKRVNRQDFEDAAWGAFVAEANLSGGERSKFRETFLAVKDVQLAVGATTAYLEVDMQARVACADGGNLKVKYPASVEELEKWNIDSLRGPGAPGGLDDSGSTVEGGVLTAVTIAVGVLAALGIAVAFGAPMLGIQLPGLPTLPF